MSEGKDDGWIEWNGGGLAPVHDDVHVSCILRNGVRLKRYRARHVDWSHRLSSHRGDVVKYKVLEPGDQPAFRGVDVAEIVDNSMKRGPFEGYESLDRILNDALEQAAVGKGRERHANDRPFDKQPMQATTDAVGLGFPLGQAIKKIQESRSMDNDAARRELLGAIVYIAGAILWSDNNVAAE